MVCRSLRTELGDVFFFELIDPRAGYKLRGLEKLARGLRSSDDSHAPPIRTYSNKNIRPGFSVFWGKQAN